MSGFGHVERRRLPLRLRWTTAPGRLRKHSAPWRNRSGKSCAPLAGLNFMHLGPCGWCRARGPLPRRRTRAGPSPPRLHGVALGPCRTVRPQRLLRPRIGPQRTRAHRQRARGQVHPPPKTATPPAPRIRHGPRSLAPVLPVQKITRTSQRRSAAARTAGARPPWTRHTFAPRTAHDPQRRPSERWARQRLAQDRGIGGAPSPCATHRSVPLTAHAAQRPPFRRSAVQRTRSARSTLIRTHRHRALG